MAGTKNSNVSAHSAAQAVGREEEPFPVLFIFKRVGKKPRRRPYNAVTLAKTDYRVALYYKSEQQG